MIYALNTDMVENLLFLANELDLQNVWVLLMENFTDKIVNAKKIQRYCLLDFCSLPSYDML